MLSEKRSLKRFLIIYILSTLLLLFIGAYFYYKVNYQSIVELNLTKMKANIEKFIQKNKQKQFLKKEKKPDYLGIPIAIYIKKNYVLGNFKPEKIDLYKRYFVYNEKLYYIHNEHKPWGDTFVITYIDICKNLHLLQQQIVLFLLVSITFIIVIAYILGKIFLKPMKNSLNLLEEFISDTTHEINTPISNILTNIELIKELNYDIEYKDELTKIETSAFRISKIFQDLSYVRFHHKQKKELTRINLKTLILQRVDFFQTFIENKNLKIDLNLTDKIIIANTEDMIRLIDNLLSNSSKYTKNNTTIEIILQNNTFTIINNGYIKDIDHVLKKFSRDAKDEGGFGLGLYIVQKIATIYDYTFTLQSTDKKVYATISNIN